MIKYIALSAGDADGIREMSEMATEIVREHFDPLIGKEKNSIGNGFFMDDYVYRLEV